ncbi:39S ribosomal protein L49, mitochondrial-like [Anneissia japonica]|uniref:39S ribosomal protein L49, mitochondrial-like n=1 Tax=Anneissia japonica TaxID=1529436 RepID=UPI0014259AA7|nr:39S ribosomal protein L49, mitochondrial-like [Anneissia japonica]
MAAYCRVARFCCLTSKCHISIMKITQRTIFSNSVRTYLPPPFLRRQQFLSISHESDIGRTGVIESKEDFKYVKRLIPPLKVPEPPQHTSYPTPCGWSPPTGAPANCPYFIRRTRYHNIPVYTEIKKLGTQILTVVSHIEGDIWALANELKVYLQPFEEYDIPMQVHEYTKQIRYKGRFEEKLKEYLLRKGF